MMTTITTVQTKKFENFKTDSLVRMVQQSDLRMQELKVDKKIDLKKEEQVLNQMRNELIGRLKEMNRLDPQFFPLRCWVLYIAEYRDEEIKKVGIVVGHTEKHVQVHFNGEIGQVLVEPAYLKLKFIR